MKQFALETAICWLFILTAIQELQLYDIQHPQSAVAMGSLPNALPMEGK